MEAFLFFAFIAMASLIGILGVLIYDSKHKHHGHPIAA